ncbi:MAG: cytochrome c [Xanthomonadales bacterium]|nr:cytochrome c [Gammaproteobacteria bacterium]NNE04590.1 cytochrome c [Xanthomonadales bacterium]NNL95604.1 cytochrome c [Xanthomonadales bacterium]
MIRIFSAIILGLCLVSTSASAEGDAAAGKIKAYTCKGCHGIPGYNNTYPTYKVPKLGGQNEAYLSSALNAYRSANRQHSTMRVQAQSLSDQDIADISAWMASIERVPATTPPAAPDAISAKVQVCTGCHGADGLSADPTYPVLAGQHANFISHALRTYRSGARQNAIMGGFSAGLTDDDIEGIAAWYASMSGLKDLSEE